MPASRKTLCSCISQRWVIVAMCFLANFISMATQVCLPITITEMVSSTNQTFNLALKLSNQTFIEPNRFDWDEKIQGLILSSFFCGYIISSLLCATIVNKLSGKHVMGFSLLLASASTLLIPVTVKRAGSTGLIFIRLLIGFIDGVLFPSIVRLMANWIPEDERSLASAWTFSGLTFGGVFGTSISGIILQRSTMGWPAVFYFFGTLGAASYVVYSGLCYDSPDDHPFITAVEKNYLKEKLRHTHKNIPPTPWRHIIRSKPIWALWFGKIGEAWSFSVLSSDTPKFMKSVLKASVETNGYVSSAPFICSAIFSFAVSWLADLVIAKKIASIGCVRKTCSSVSFIGFTTLLIIATYVGTDRVAVVVLYIFAMMMHNCVSSSTMVNSLDLSPNYASIVQSLLFGLATITSFMAPYVVGVLTPEQTITQWRHVFFLMFAICVTANMIFVIFGSGEVQQWNDPTFVKRGEQIKERDIVENNELLFMK